MSINQRVTIPLFAPIMLAKLDKIVFCLIVEDDPVTSRGSHAVLQVISHLVIQRVAFILFVQRLVGVHHPR